MTADDKYEQQNDATGGDVPTGEVADNDYASRSGQSGPIPVQKDSAPVEDPIDPVKADTDEQLGMLRHIQPVLKIDPSNPQQPRMTKRLSIRATSSRAVPVALPSQLVPTRSLVMRR